MANSFPHLEMDDGKRVYFGQSLAEVEEMFGVPGREQVPELAPHVPNQRIIESPTLTLTFDAGRLMRMEFLRNFDFRIPLAPYFETWKNIGSFPNTAGDMTREAAAACLTAWEARAVKLGIKKIEPGDLAADEYYPFSDTDEYWNVLGLNLGKSRRARGGGLWMDGWIINFATAQNAERDRVPLGLVRSVSAFCDEFNTVARR